MTNLENEQMPEEWDEYRWRPTGKIIGISKSLNVDNELICKLRSIGDTFDYTDRFIFAVPIDTKFLWLRIKADDIIEKHWNFISDR